MADVCIKIFTTRAEAELAKKFLEEEDIESSVVCDDAGGNFSPIAGGFCLLVNKDDKLRALHLLHSIGGQGFKKNPE
ncbi:MAG TPA: hypothetical protein VLG44_08175 [Chlamydiales bacterium]|nr:hypothetical protein [Chlamydiales bacterium]